MAQRQGSRNIEHSICQIRKQVPGNQFATTGSACVLIWPWKLGQGQTSASPATETFLVTTSQVVKKADLNSHTAWKAEFLSVRKILGSEKFSLNSVPVYEESTQSQVITLILIPTEPLKNQIKLSLIRGTEFPSARSQPCYRRESDLECKATNAKQLLYCYVLSESASSNDKFALQCYLLHLDEGGSYFLQAHGSEAKLRKAEDFQYTEKPKGSVILNEYGYIVGFLAFSDEDDHEILPLFFPQNVQDDNQPLKVMISPEDTKESKAVLQECSGRDGEASQRSHASKDGDENRNQTEENVFPSSSIEPPRKGDRETDLQDMKREENEHVIAISNLPSELSYVSVSGEMSDDPNSGVPKGKKASISGGDISSTPQNLEAKAPPLSRCYSEQTAMTPKPKRKLQKCYSEMHSMPLKPGTRVENVVLQKAFVIDALSRLLDPTNKRLKNWRHLAQLNDVSTDLESTQEHHSRSEAMFNVLVASNPSLPIGTVRSVLQELRINQVTEYIACLDDQMTIEAFLEETDPSIPGRVFITLDRLTDEKWQKLGIKLGIDRGDLKAITTNCANQHQNPAGEVIDIICAKDPTMTIGQFKRKLSNIKRTDVKNKLDHLNETYTICDLRDDLDLMRTVTTMLNVSDAPQVKNYKDLADDCDISSELYQSLEPPCGESPTKAVINDIVERRPTYSVEDLFTNLRDIQRLDAIEAISPYFVEEDVRALKRKLKISDE